jgi:two-component system response regulator LytT
MEQKTGFFRVHKSFIVNIDHIKELYPWTNGTYKIIMDDLNKSEITVSRTYVNNLKNLIGI